MNRPWLWLLAGLLLVSSGAARALTLEQAFSAPWTSQLIAARAAPRIAWVTERRGLSNVYVADAPRYEPRQLTHYTADDGLSVQQLVISDDGRTLVFAHHAGGPNGQGELANPTADVSDHAKHEVIALDVATGAARQLSDSFVGAQQLMIPDEEHFIDRWQTWLTIERATIDFFDRKLAAGLAKGPARGTLGGPP